MPLRRSGTPAAISQNIREMENAGHPHDVSVAAALHTADQVHARTMASEANEMRRADQPLKAKRQSFGA